VIEINGAVDFTGDYALDGGDVFGRAVEPFAPGRRHTTLGPADEDVPALIEAVSL
jgi:hypothetical protein